MPDLVRHPPFFGGAVKEGGPRIKSGVTTGPQRYVTFLAASTTSAALIRASFSRLAA